MTDFLERPHAFACTSHACPEFGIPKDAMTPIIGDVYCGDCGTICEDVGPVDVPTPKEGN